MFNSEGKIVFLEDKIINPFGSLEYILSEKDLKIDFLLVKEFSEKHSINWRHKATYDPKGNGIAEE